jgi:hypothetical protein
MIETVKFGFELYEKFSKNREIQRVLKDNLYRELKFNLAILNEIEKCKNKINFIRLILLFKTEFYRTIRNSFIDIRKIIDEQEININETVIKNKNFLKWFKNIKTNVKLIEKIYFRIDVLKSLAKVEITKRKDSYQYLKTLMLVLKKEIENE